MEIYKNDYNKNEDPMMWELHEIQNRIQKDIKSKSIDEINLEGQNILHKIHQKYNNKDKMKVE